VNLFNSDQGVARSRCRLVYQDQVKRGCRLGVGFSLVAWRVCVMRVSAIWLLICRLGPVGLRWLVRQRDVQAVNADRIVVEQCDAVGKRKIGCCSKKIVVDVVEGTNQSVDGEV
jgi:hypothetical protein